MPTVGIIGRRCGADAVEGAADNPGPQDADEALGPTRILDEHGLLDRHRLSACIRWQIDVVLGKSEVTPERLPSGVAMSRGTEGVVQRRVSGTARCGPINDAVADAASRVSEQRQLPPSARTELGLAILTVAFERPGREGQLGEPAERDELGGEIAPHRGGVSVLDDALCQCPLEVQDRLLGGAEIRFHRGGGLRGAREPG